MLLGLSPVFLLTAPTSMAGAFQLKVWVRVRVRVRVTHLDGRRLPAQGMG
jgi:hypothetical protein